LYFSGTWKRVNGILDDLFFYECFDVSGGQRDLDVVAVMSVALLVAKRERKGLFNTRDARHGESVRGEDLVS
jgi:hypothetical protein